MLMIMKEVKLKQNKMYIGSIILIALTAIAHFKIYGFIYLTLPDFNAFPYTTNK